MKNNLSLLSKVTLISYFFVYVLMYSKLLFVFIVKLFVLEAFISIFLFYKLSLFFDLIILRILMCTISILHFKTVSRAIFLRLFTFFDRVCFIRSIASILFFIIFKLKLRNQIRVLFKLIDHLII